MTSSETSSTSYWSQISRTRSKYPGGGGKQPPAFCTGSRKTAATVSGPSISMASPMRSAAHRPNAFGSSRRWSGARYSLVFGTLCAPGTSGSNCCLERRQAGDRQGPVRGAVVRDRPRDHLVLVRLAGELEVVLGQLPGGLDGLAAAGGEEDVVEVARGVGRQPLRQVDRLRVRVGPQREERELLGLRRVPPRPARCDRARPARRTARRARRCTGGPGRPRCGGPGRARSSGRRASQALCRVKWPQRWARAASDRSVPRGVVLIGSPSCRAACAASGRRTSRWSAPRAACGSSG